MTVNQDLATRISQRVVIGIITVVTIFGVVLPTVARASQVTERSIKLSSSSISAENVTYQVNFTSVNSAEAFVVQFCSNSPLIGQSCLAPADFDATGAESSSIGFTDVTGSTNLVLVAGTIDAQTEISVEIAGITNPSAAGSLYARIVTYDTKSHAENYTATDLGSGVQDEGGVAIAITPTIGISGTVLETMTFCVSGGEISADCGDIVAPTITLGEEVGPGVVALTAGTISTGSIYTQISTNASSGAVIRLKSNAINCGGLIRAGAPEACDIAPALNSGINAQANQAKFGVITSNAVGTPNAGANGTLVPVTGSGYNNTTYALNYTAGNTAGVTSTFGDAFLDTAGAPANNQNMLLTFGATIANNTPAGDYSVSLSLIASGKF